MPEPRQGSVRFHVLRTSIHNENTPPCDDAVKGTIRVFDRRTFKTPAEHDAKLGEPWLARGTEHGFWLNADGSRGGIQRRMPDHVAWFVEFSTLEDLLAFQRKHGELIIAASYADPEQFKVEIYDDYRE